MKRLWLADVHANLPAFEAVLHDAGQVDEVIFVGDIVGCGPRAASCLELLRSLRPRAVLGNHDAVVLQPPTAVRACDGGLDWYALEQLTVEQRAYLEALPQALDVRMCGQSARALHQLPDAPYLHPAMPDTVLAPHLALARAPLVVCGHSHRALDRTVAGRRLVVIPAVGQPRNGDPRAGYALEKNGHLSFHFVPYDLERTARDTLALGLPEPFCSRWLRFLLTGGDPEWSRDYCPDGDGPATVG